MTTVALYPLHISAIEDGAAEVGRPDTGVFISLPEQGVDIIRDLQQGLTLDEVSQRFAGKYGEAPDLNDFLAALEECGFVRAPGSEEPVAEDGPQMRGWRLLAGLPTSKVAWLLSRPAMVLWAVVWVAVPAIFIFRPDLLPDGAADGRLGLGVALDALALTVLGWGLIFLHEVAHLIAVRARGCTGVLRLSHRLHLLAAETDMSAVRTLSRGERYAPYLAGMTFNLTVLGITLVLRMAGFSAQLLPAIGYLCAVTLLLELAFFMRTDVYYVIVNWLRLGNLMGDAWQWVGNLLARLTRRPTPYDLSTVPARELRIVRWYVVFMVGGVVVFVGQFIWLALPLLFSFVADSGARIASGPATVGFWDAVLLMALAVAHFGTLGYVALMRRLRPVAAGA